MALSRARFRRKYPTPPPTPEGMVWATHPQRGTMLVPMELLSAIAAKRMGNYDLYPREVRDAKKYKSPRPI